jgi:hypothetical protein
MPSHSRLPTTCPGGGVCLGRICALDAGIVAGRQADRLQVSAG